MKYHKSTRVPIVSCSLGRVSIGVIVAKELDTATPNFSRPAFGTSLVWKFLRVMDSLIIEHNSRAS